MSSNCIDPIQPNIMFCFEAHRTELLDFHLEQLKNIAAKIAKSHKSGRPINLVHLTGHAATWRGITKVEYWRRATVRANNASFFLVKALKAEGVELSKVALIPTSEADSNPRETNSTKKGRALNRRVEITLDRAVPPPKNKKRRCLIGDKIKAAPVAKEAANATERLHLKCFQSFLAKALCGDLVDGRYWTFKKFAHWGATRGKKPKNVVKIFRMKMKKGDTPAMIAEKIKETRDDFHRETNKLIGALADVAGDPGREDTNECAWGLELEAASKRSKPPSIYRCMKKELTRAVTNCLP